MSENIKNSAITAAGYIYQTRQGLKVLCDWLDAPSRYNRVKFECDVEKEAPQGLDDIVIERTDGFLDLQQVKFTPDSDKHLLCWDWLLDKSGKTARSRSMIKKWFDAYNKLEPDRIGDISLITNRRPDAEIEGCLVNGKICFSKIHEPNRSRVISELGSVASCEAFFNQLSIRHSDKGYETLEYQIDASLKAHGSSEGIATLKNVAINWATKKNCPNPDGWITLPEIRTILRASPVAPLPEDFIVPNGYQVPDEIFHQRFVSTVINSVGKTIVLSGPPGRGKSTYLSYLFEELTDENVPMVRHHYYLSTTERGRDRINSYIVEESIKAQIEQFHSEVTIPSRGLRALLEACASHYKKSNKPFVVILDGLDHVWRTNAKDKQPLDDLFSQIIPCPDNMILLIGTQPVDDAQLPTDLLISAPKSSWYTLPAMSENSVFGYLHKMLQEGKLSTTSENQKIVNEHLQEAASALCQRTKGHPLHVIYAAAELAHNASWDVEQLKGDLTKDVSFYYGSLWGSLSESLKDVLRLVCAFPFFWPKTAFVEIAEKRRAAVPDVGNVEHLLYASSAGFKVFHESLAVFVRATENYEDYIQKLMPFVANWLDYGAPNSLRVNWLWTVQARLGNPSNLISGLTRDWIMQRLKEGYSELLFDTLLSDSLMAALNTAKFADAYRLAHLKDRMVGGSEFQMQSDDKARLMSFTWTLTTEDSVIRETFATRHEADILELAALGLALRARGEIFDAEKCGEELFRRLHGISRFTNRYSSSSGSDEYHFIFSALAQLNALGETTDSLTYLVNENPSAIWLPRVQLLIEDENLDELMAVTNVTVNFENKKLLSDACIRASAFAGVCITARDDFHSLLLTPLVACVEDITTRSCSPLNVSIPIKWQDGDYYAQKEDLATLIHHWFFSSVHLEMSMALEGQTKFEYVPAPLFNDRENITDLLNTLAGIASKVAHYWLRGDSVQFHQLYEMFEPIELHTFRQNHQQKSATEDFRRSLHRVACDIHLVSILLNDTDSVLLSEESIRKAIECKWFDEVSFREQYSENSLVKMTNEAASVFIQSQYSLWQAEVQEETSVHLMMPLQLCSIAVKHNLISQARELCIQTWELTTGYSHRKDPTLSNTVSAIGYLVESAPKEALQLLSQISPQIHNVLNYTDGKGTRHILEATDELLAKLNPAALIVKFNEHTDMGQWSEAENSLRAYVAQGVKNGWPLDSLMRTGLHAEIHQLLEEQALEGCAYAAELLSTLDNHSGWDIGLLCREEYSSGISESGTYEGDPTTFEPEQFDSLLDSFSGSYEQRQKFVQDWYDYWDKNGQGRRLLDVIDKKLLHEKERHSELSYLYESAFHTRRRLSGKKSAWKYLVRAQIMNGGWFWFEGEKNTLNRLNLITKFYPEHGDKFVSETTYAMFSEPEENRIAPNDAMVYFYVKQGRIEEGINFAKTMVDSVIDDTRTLPLKQPRWGLNLSLTTSLEE
ncbi:NACHT domain-containing protein [Proteus mirabilis]|uniref:NACHT domain-containing protein n=1 Tax=Proteus mirabilis TaxID=584 RepID=UPI0018C7D1D2|nr:NACHT domain-containing protein [Proteus mirabilis]